MLEPLIEVGGLVIGLLLLLYFQVWRPSREAARPGPIARDKPDTPPSPADRSER